MSMLTVILGVLYAGMFAVLLSNLWYLRRRETPEPDGPLPAFSVLIPARNEERRLQALIPSLLDQDYPDLEVIVYDDGSEDGTPSVLRSFSDGRLRTLRGEGPPPGWVGKTHALYQAARQARGEVYLFLDADALLRHPAALRRLARVKQTLPAGSVVTGLTRLEGGGRLLVSMVPAAILTSLPWPLVRRLRAGSLGALNGQCWMIDAEAYHRYEPHERCRAEVLEDVLIGRYLKARGLTPVLVDLLDDVTVTMYRSFGSAWRGFRKNAYLILGGKPVAFAATLAVFAGMFVVGPLYSWGFLPALYLAKTISDRRAGFPWWVSALTPAAYLLAVVLALDSAASHWLGRVTWKGRTV